MKITLYNGDAENFRCRSDLIFTDPPYDMSAEKIVRVLSKVDCDHLFMMSTMRQAIEFFKISDFELSFDCVMLTGAPRRSLSVRKPHYTHATMFYAKRNGAKSIFDRKKHQRSDTFDGNGYWPTVLDAPRERQASHGMAKSIEMVKDIIGSFECRSVYDPFVGSGTTAFACFDLGVDCTCCEIEKKYFDSILGACKFFNCNVEVVNE